MNREVTAEGLRPMREEAPAAEGSKEKEPCRELEATVSVAAVR